MTKLRVHELAKELGMENKDLMEILEKKNVEAKTSMSSIPDEVVAELRSGHAGKGTSEDAPKKQKYRTGIPPTEFEERKPPSGRIPFGKWTEHTGNIPSGSSGRRKKRTASGFRSEWIPSGSSGERAAGKWREREQKTTGRTPGRKPTSGRGTERRFPSESSGRWKKRAASVFCSKRSERKPSPGRGGKKLVSVRIPEETTEMTETTEISIPSPLVEQQKPQRNKAKDKEKRLQEKMKTEKKDLKARAKKAESRSRQ